MECVAPHEQQHGHEAPHHVPQERHALHLQHPHRPKALRLLGVERLDARRDDLPPDSERMRGIKGMEGSVT